jgi:hypothetical protein
MTDVAQIAGPQPQRTAQFPTRMALQSACACWNVALFEVRGFVLVFKNSLMPSIIE